MRDYLYQGAELDLFKHAIQWKKYYAARLRPYIAGDVVEVGAGIGGTTRFLCEQRHHSWTCVEPDAALANRLRVTLTAQPLPARARVVCGTLDALEPEEQFDTVLYIDVVEHIVDDSVELQRGARRLRRGGHLIVLSPAHNWLFSPFDTAIGHHRRYTKATLLRAAPQQLQLVRAFYLDSIGMVASLSNRALLRSTYPTLSQIRFWDSTLVRASRILDPLTGYRLGKTVVAIWTCQGPRDEP